MIPDELRQRDQWVAWKYRTRDTKPTKVPISPTRGTLASSTDPQTWGTYREALSVLDSEGVGFVFAGSDPYCGIDLDGVVSATGRVHDAAYRIVSDLDGYWEFSPSGLGLHVIVRGELERGRHTLKTPWHDELAVYDRDRFFTMSGEGRGEIREAQAELNSLVSFYFPEPDQLHGPDLVRDSVDAPFWLTRPPCEDDAAVLDRIRADPRIDALWGGDTAGHGGDHSAADLALCAHLAFYTGSDGARIDALFRRSGLMRDKWDERRGDSTYGAITIERAMRGT